MKQLPNLFITLFIFIALVACQASPTSQTVNTQSVETTTSTTISSTPKAVTPETVATQPAPLPLVAPTDGKVQIIILPIHRQSGANNAPMQNVIAATIQAHLKLNQIETISVQTISEDIENLDLSAIAKLSETYSAPIILWGSADDDTATIEVVAAKLSDLNSSITFNGTIYHDVIVKPDEHITIEYTKLPDDWRVLSEYAIGQALIAQGDVEEGTLIIDAAVYEPQGANTLEETQSGHIFFQLGWLNQSMMRLDQASYYYSLAIQNNPQLAGAFNNRGLVSAKLNDFNVMSDLFEAMNLDPLLYNELEQFESLLSDIDSELENADSEPKVYLSEEGQTATSPELIELNQTIERNPDDENALFTRGTIHFELNNYIFALADFDQVLALNPKNIGALISRGITHSCWFDDTAALSDFDSASAMGSNDIRLFYRRGDVYWRVGQHDNALIDYERAITLDPNFFASISSESDLDQRFGNLGGKCSFNLELDNSNNLVFLNLGAAYVAIAEQEYQFANYDNAALLNPTFFAAIYNYKGWEYFWVEEYEFSLELFDQATTLDPESADHFLDRGFVHTHLGNHQEALDDYQQALDLETSPTIRKTIKDQIKWEEYQLSQSE